MPIFKVGEQVCFFAHVPKCAGTSIEDYLAKRFGQLAFQNRKFKPGHSKNWLANSPQHIPAPQLSTLFPQGFFDAGFAFVRNPVDRFLSAFNFHQVKRGKIAANVTPQQWLTDLPKFDPERHALYDNHFLPQVTFVPEWCEVFKLEDGFDGFYAWLEALTGEQTSAQVGQKLAGKYENPELNAEFVASIERLYTEDYDAFGYEKRGSMKLA
ncbi:sulfotransferase family 2 domain-containing protein [Falsirhodobacter sp. 20TX0035]|uniref:sulfotransferase family 2 domain-containing protein n=1 Tax=Falsirhodobacter sp. 20TX0035 TaxID=3022019 RepID=UPI00232A8322|nr:sulfotransferase family 2 domain-containing protein [Falsirhodobacter sp. 20TX0035]MDB6455045.1 sulfotransferase family 2 domain-containing protein [Falsirhodobacter sp. 20TX0035]